MISNNGVVSIIIPVYNRINLISETLHSVYKQTFSNWEIIIVDDGSSDGTFEMVLKEAEKDSRVHVIKNTSGIKGPSSARNIGLKDSKGEFVLFLDSDDLLKPFCLQQRFGVLNNNKHLAFAIFLQETFEGESNIITGLYNLFPSKNETDLHLFLRNNNPWQTMGVLWDKTILQELGGFDSSFFYMEDPELHTRALLNSKYQYRVFKELPADCLFRLSNMDGDKKETFYHYSIIHRFRYLQKTLTLIRDSDLKKNEKLIAERHWKKGVYNLFRNFLLSRLIKYKSETSIFLDLCYSQHVFSSVDQIKLRLIMMIWGTESKLLKIMKLQGFFYKILFYLTGLIINGNHCNY